MYEILQYLLNIFFCKIETANTIKKKFPLLGFFSLVYIQQIAHQDWYHWHSQQMGKFNNYVHLIKEIK